MFVHNIFLLTDLCAKILIWSTKDMFDPWLFDWNF